MRVLIVDDDPWITKALQQLLTEYQFATDIAHDGKEGLDMAGTAIYDLLIVDVMMPQMTGPTVVKTLREEGISTPVLLLTARDAVHDRVDGLDSGADDYLTKPFQASELLARVRALTRRATQIQVEKRLLVGDYELLPVQGQVLFKGNSIALTHNELKLLTLFVNNVDRIIVKTRLLEQVWGYHSGIESGSLETLVHTLRKKLTNAALATGMPASHGIETVRGTGYRFRRHY